MFNVRNFLTFMHKTCPIQVDMQFKINHLGCYNLNISGIVPSGLLRVSVIIQMAWIPAGESSFLHRYRQATIQPITRALRSGY